MSNLKPIKAKRYGGWTATIESLAPKHTYTRAWWAKDAEMIITDKTIWTIAPSPPAPTRSNTYSNWGESWKT